MNELNVIEMGASHDDSVVFLHGLGVGAWSWNEPMQALSPGRHVLAIDLPGCSGSHAVRWESLAASADAIAQVVRTRCRGRVHLVGHSLGGFTALTLLSRHPELVRSAFITGVRMPPRLRWLWSLVIPVVAALLTSRLWAHAMVRLLRPDDEVRARIMSDAKVLRARTVRAISRELMAFRLPSLPAVPLVAAAGSKERAVVEALDVICAGRPEAQRLIVPNAGHLWLVERPAFFLAVLGAFLEGRTLPAE